MPTYEYACISCGRHVEAVQSMSDPPLRECEHCGGELRKVFSPVGIVFKGSGFYKTDSRGGSGRKSTPDSKDRGRGDSTKPADGSSSKPDSSSSDGGTTTPSSTPAPKTGGDSGGKSKDTKSS